MLINFKIRILLILILRVFHLKTCYSYTYNIEIFFLNSFNSVTFPNNNKLDDIEGNICGKTKVAIMEIYTVLSEFWKIKK